MEKTYVIAVRKESRQIAGNNWQQRLAELPGVSVINATPYRAMITATDEGIEVVRSTLGAHCAIEEPVQREAM